MDKVTEVAGSCSHQYYWDDKDYLVTKLENKKTLNRSSLEFLLEALRDYPSWVHLWRT